MSQAASINVPDRTSAAAGLSMRGVVHPRYGTPAVLTLQEIERPIPGNHEVLVRVHAAGVSVGDHHVVTGKPYVIRPSLGGLLRPKHRVAGQAMAGVVEAVGAEVSAFHPGDAVYGDGPGGAFAEYAVMPEDRIAPKPSSLSFEEAACASWALAALQGLRDVAGLRKGQRVLINGASGGVGTWAVQIGKALGAEVTAVCSTRNLEMVRALGADEVVDYTKRDFTLCEPRFDVVFDTVGNRSISACRSVLAPRGTFVSCSGGSSGMVWLGRLLSMLVVSPFTQQKLAALITAPNRKDLIFLTDLIERSKIKPVIERRYPLHQTAEALEQVGLGHAQGQTVIQIVGSASGR